MSIEVRHCEDCDRYFFVNRKGGHGRRYCNPSCRGRARRRVESYRAAERIRIRERYWHDDVFRKRSASYRHRQVMPQWAKTWEAKRYREDERELAEAERCEQARLARFVMPVSARPKSRLFIAHICQASGCGATWISYEAMPDCDYCSVCNPKRWRDNHRKRTKSGVEREHIDRHAVFERDGYRCQICGKKTRGKYPAPSSPSLDHITPLSKGGTHTWDNVRCAHFGCNARKAAGAANDQMLLPLGPPPRPGGTG